MPFDSIRCWMRRRKKVIVYNVKSPPRRLNVLNAVCPVRFPFRNILITVDATVFSAFDILNVFQYKFFVFLIQIELFGASSDEGNEWTHSHECDCDAWQSISWSLRPSIWCTEVQKINLITRAKSLFLFICANFPVITKWMKNNNNIRFAVSQFMATRVSFPFNFILPFRNVFYNLSLFCTHNFVMFFTIKYSRIQAFKVSRILPRCYWRIKTNFSIKYP